VHTAVARGKMTFGDALANYKQQRENDPNINPEPKNMMPFVSKPFEIVAGFEKEGCRQNFRFRVQVLE